MLARAFGNSHSRKQCPNAPQRYRSSQKIETSSTNFRQSALSVGFVARWSYSSSVQFVEVPVEIGLAYPLVLTKPISSPSTLRAVDFGLPEQADGLAEAMLLWLFPHHPPALRHHSPTAATPCGPRKRLQFLEIRFLGFPRSTLPGHRPLIPQRRFTNAPANGSKF